MTVLFGVYGKFFVEHLAALGGLWHLIPELCGVISSWYLSCVSLFH